MKKEINKDSSISLHIQIRNEVLGNILNGILKPGDKLPSEKELSQRFNVSRTTVRLALTNLSQKELIYSKPGKGTYVASSVMYKPKMKLIGFVVSPDNESFIKKVELIEGTKYRSMEQICSRLQIALGEKIISILSLRKANNNVIGMDKSYLPYRYMSKIIEMDMEGKSLEKIMQVLGKIPKKVEQMIQVCYPDEDTSNYLNLGNNIPVIFIERLSFLVGDTPIEYRKSFYKVDSYKLSIIMEEDQMI